MSYDFGNVFQFLLKQVAIAGKSKKEKGFVLKCWKAFNFGMQ